MPYALVNTWNSDQRIQDGHPEKSGAETGAGAILFACVYMISALEIAGYKLTGSTAGFSPP